MADKVRINENALATAYPDMGRMVAKGLNTVPGFVARINEFKDLNLSGVFGVIFNDKDHEAFVDPIKGSDSNFGFYDSWLSISFTDGRDIDRWLIWLPDLLNEPDGEYVVYEVAVSVEGFTEDPFLFQRPDIPDKFIPQSDNGRKSYIGVTKCGFKKRMYQHGRDAVTNKGYVFHRFMKRQFKAANSCAGVQGRVLRTGLTRDQAMDAEEALVEGSTLYPIGLNSIPGGYAGMRYLAERNFKTNARRLIDDRAGELTKFFKRNPNNPLLALRMQSDDELISRIICKNPRNFGLSEVRQIRAMYDLGYTEEQIAEEMKANQQRIHNLLTDKTYSRVR